MERDFEQGSVEAQLKYGGAKKKGGRPRKQRLVSYSNQDSNSQDESCSRKSSRKRTAVSKLGALMIDSITREGKSSGRGRGSA